MNNSGHSHSRKIETAAGIKQKTKTNEDSHGNQESAQRLQSPTGFFNQPKQQKRRDRAALKNHNYRITENTSRGKH